MLSLDRAVVAGNTYSDGLCLALDVDLQLLTRPEDFGKPVCIDRRTRSSDRSVLLKYAARPQCIELI